VLFVFLSRPPGGRNVFAAESTKPRRAGALADAATGDILGRSVNQQQKLQTRPANADQHPYRRKPEHRRRRHASPHSTPASVSAHLDSTTQAEFSSPSLPAEGGESRGEEGLVFIDLPSPHSSVVGRGSRSRCSPTWPKPFSPVYPKKGCDKKMCDRIFFCHRHFESGFPAWTARGFLNLPVQP
jgi:hypothetical protein